MKTAILIKRYANRKLYNTNTSSYTTLAEILQLVRGGLDVTVIANATGKLLTREILLRALYEESLTNDIPTLEQLIGFARAAATGAQTELEA